jgi:4-amino-4-deoxy-L-arabinose transferase-like glycosyltransferase
LRLRWRPSRFTVGLAVIAAVALVIQVAAAYWYDVNFSLAGDAIWYDGVARYIADGRGFFNLWLSLGTGQNIPTAAHPPVFPAFLSVPKVLGFDTTLAARLWCTVPGTFTVVLLGLLTRDLFDETAGLLAAGLAAVFAELWVQDVLVWSEGMFAFLVVLTVLVSYRFIKRPDLAHAAVLGGAISLLSLTRAEGVLLYPILLLPLVLRVRGASLGRRAALLGSAFAVSALLFAPWTIYNSRRFEHPVFVSTGLGGVLVSSNCPRTYGGPLRGGWGFVCLPEAENIDPRTDETVVEQRLRRAGIRYARDHSSRLAVVVPFRLLRTLGFYKPFAVTAGDMGQTDGGAWMPRAGTIQYWVMLPFGAVGLVALRRRGVPLLPLLDMIGIAVFITVLGYGTMRFRIALDAVLPALAACGAVTVWRNRPGRVPASVGVTARSDVTRPAEPVVDAAR